MHRYTEQCGHEIRTRRTAEILGKGDASRLNPAHVARLERLLDDLADASSPAEMDLPGLQLHQLTGNRQGTWAVRVSGNRRLTFRFEDGEAVDVTLEEYH